MLNKKVILFLSFIAVTLSFTSCHSDDHHHDTDNNHVEEQDSHHERDEVRLSVEQLKSLEVKIDTIPMRKMASYVEASGQLEVPPQNEASVTAIIGANVVSIEVIEGDEIAQGQVLAYLSHPDLIGLQTEYLNSWNRLQFLEKEYQRKKVLYEENIGSGREFQQIQSEYQSAKGMVKGYEVQLKLMGLKIEQIRNNELFERTPVKSPIEGFVRKVHIKTGQYVEPHTEMFEIVNIHHIHTDLMVFEKDMHKVKEGQKVRFTIESLPGKELEATIYSVGKAFEQNPKAIHLHAEIENKEGLLLPGMYVRGRIITGERRSLVLPEEAVIREGDESYIFKVENDTDGEAKAFKPVQVVTGRRDKGWVEIELIEPLEKESKVALNSAYYLMAEMKKGEGGHNHSH